MGADSDTGVGCKGGNYPAWLKLGDGPKGYYFEFIVENLILALVREGDICCDVGVNFGAHSWTMLQACGESGRVHGFEPNPVCLRALEGWPQVGRNFVIHPVALSDHKAEGTLFADAAMKISTLHPEIQTRHGLVPEQSFVVPLMTLDSFNLPRCRFLKIDVDGEELNCLRGSRSTIERLRPFVLVEVTWEMMGLADVDELDRWLDLCSYQMLNLFDGAAVGNRRTDSWMVVLWPREIDTQLLRDVVCKAGQHFIEEIPDWNHYAKFSAGK